MSSEHVDPRLAEQTEGPRLGMRRRRGARTTVAVGRPRAAATRSTWNARGRRRDVRVEAAAGGRDEVDRDRRRRGPAPAASRRRRPRSRSSALVGPRLLPPSCRHRSRRRPPPRAADGSSAAPAKAWPTSVEPTTLAVRARSGCHWPRTGNSDLRDAGHGERIGDAECRAIMTTRMTRAGRSWESMGRSPQAMPRAVTTRSMTLMPTKGTIRPPRP